MQLWLEANNTLHRSEPPPVCVILQLLIITNFTKLLYLAEGKVLQNMLTSTE